MTISTIDGITRFLGTFNDPVSAAAAMRVELDARAKEVGLDRHSVIVRVYPNHEYKIEGEGPDMLAMFPQDVTEKIGTTEVVGIKERDKPFRFPQHG